MNRLITAAHTILFLMFVAGLTGCVEDDAHHRETHIRDVTDNQMWTPAHAEPDALHAHRPLHIECAPDALLAVDGVLDMNTGECGYIAVEQPLMETIPKGATLQVRGAHLTLFDPETVSAEGHAALAIDGEVIWERTFQIPSMANAWEEEVVSPRTFSAGSTVVFHLHNHGSNEWKLWPLNAELLSNDH